jgi:YidC/Oxa1 family membrane protein insertase
VDKKTIPIVILLIVLIVFWWDILEFVGLVKPQVPVQKAETPADTTKVVAPDTIKPAPIQAAIVTPDSSKAIVPPDSSKAIVPQENIKPDTIVVKTKPYTITLSSYGGGPVSIKLNKYSYRDGTPVEMLPNCHLAVPEATFAGGTFSTSSVNFSSNLPAGNYDATQQPLDLIYTYTAPTGGEIIRHFRFYPDQFDYQLTFDVKDRDKLGFDRQYNLVWNNPLGITEPDKKTDYQAMEAVAMMSGSREKLNDFEDGKLNQSLTGNTTWAGVRSKYFSAVLIPRNRPADGVFARGQKMRVETPKGRVDETHITTGIDMPFASVNSVSDTFSVFVGPLDYTLMAHYDIGLQDMLDIGTTPYIGWIIKPFALAIIWLLPRMHSIFPNYGIVIILFALLIKIVTLPLSMKQYKSMNAMRELQPKIDELRKKLKNKPQELNTETMKLYKEHGVNPFSGCLPLLAQMPLFFAMFSVFRSTILLRGAPFVYPFLDLSVGASSITDPNIILVILMVAFQFISQKLTMPPNQQNKMLMYMMPLIFGFMFFSLASGLVLYWTVFSLFSIGDYYIFRRNKKNQEVKTI